MQKRDPSVYETGTPHWTPSKERAPRRRRTRVLILLVTVVAAVVVVAVLGFVPFAHDYAFSLPACPIGSNQLVIPENAPVVVDWSTSDGSNVTFSMGSESGPILYDAYGSSGSLSFTLSFAEATWFSVTRGISCTTTVEVSGHFDSPILSGLAGPN